ncbi:hypothetical protein AUJ66_04560 [Candidatus Desantisbacteria bacterium CG1_02_38_46]|uniref:Peptide transporter n=3 Tax=unclassified Candidatus Desantisiibacteriota TaxID=3106372 RepID=A0A2H9PAT9_9BACT|nr:MAG: hypothetical protein AUJ66_04560 [Candidatus Desantisbacteria bacterium CG1_02_38_46]PIU50934.1 MAG: hypothetical protein COS91_07130 [Candidatus Desantisbacteria bacterium CG07_land_8_20_14_0_80_39_15]PIZ15708.1 MAG: hypothetical protein COY51_04565 [Candidatus Desantisbacteria bacterium CG_4_10_14_0_8_um_filter_39_17]
MNNKESGFTRRAFILGALFSFLIAVGVPYGEGYLKGSYMALDFSTGAAIFLFFILVFGINTILKAVNKNYGLNSQELLTVYIMMIITCTIPTMGLTFYWLPLMPAAFYYATPENRWQEVILPHIRPWLTPKDPLVLKYFYEGAPRGTGVPWNAWIGPLFAWSIFLLALYFVMICMMSILRKQWVEKERLTFPLAQLPVEMAKEGSNSIIPSLFKNKLMWIGFIITFIIGTFNGLHHYFHFFPRINTQTFIPIFRQTIKLDFRLSFPMIGFTYLVPTCVSFSMWFFALFYIIERGIFNITGFGINEITDIYTQSCGDATIGHQGVGAIFVLVIMGLWIGRKHLKDVFLKAIGRGKNIDDSEEMLSYSVAFWGMITGLIIMGIWLWLSGISLIAVVIFLFALFAFFLGVTRIIAEGGTPLARAPSIASFFVISGFGTSILGPVGLTSMAFSWIYASDTRIFVMGSAANGLKIAEGRKRLRPLFWAMMLAVIIGVAGSAWITLKLAYQYGGINLNSWFFQGAPNYTFKFTANKILNPTGPHPGGWAFTILGGAVMWSLIFLYHRFHWWPLHPLGFPAATIEFIQLTWISIFVAWLIKTIVLRYGGPKLYKDLKPLFFGLIIGQFTVSGVWLIIDWIVGGQGNMLFWI